MYVSVEEIKRHLNIDYEEDDLYLQDLIEAAEDAIERFIQQTLKDVEVDGKLPASLKHAVRLMVGGFYANREPAAFAAASEIPYNLHFLIIQFRKLS